MTRAAVAQPSGNRLLDGLPREEYERLLLHAEQVYLPQGQSVVAPEKPVEHIHFPTGALISLVSLMRDGGAVEAGLAGREGMTGLSALLGVRTTPMENVAQIAGGAVKVNVEAVQAEFDRDGVFQHRVRRYMHALFVTSAQTTACNRLHNTEQRLARWLLRASDATGSEDLPLTQEYLGVMLGVRRAGVTEVAIRLRDQGIIDYVRGHIRIVERRRLEQVGCECYGVIKKEFDEMLGDGHR